MFSCILHSWTSYESPCPICCPVVTITTTSATYPEPAPTTSAIKEEDSKDWEIVSFLKDGKLLVQDKDKWKYRNELNAISDIDWLIKNCPIHSVLRKSDEVVFTVGDEMEGLGHYQNEVHPITKIYPINGTIALGYGEDGARTIQSAIKKATNPISITSKDGELTAK